MRNSSVCQTWYLGYSFIFALAACGSTNSSQSASKSEPAVGTPASTRGTPAYAYCDRHMQQPKSAIGVKDNGLHYGTADFTPTGTFLR